MFCFARKRLFILILLAAVVCVAAVAVINSRSYVTDDNNPELVLQQFVDFVSSGDIESAIEMTGATTDLSDAVSGSDFSGSAEAKIIQSVFLNIKIQECSSINVDGKKAWVDIILVHPDAGLIIKKALEGVMQETHDYEWKNGSYKNEEQISQAVRESLSGHIGDELKKTMITEKIRVQFRFHSGKWEMLMTDELYDALTGGISKATESVDEFFKENNNK